MARIPLNRRLGPRDDRYKKKRAVERDVRLLNAARPMISTAAGPAKAVKLLIAHVESDGTVAQSRYDSDRYGSIVCIYASIHRVGDGYVARYRKCRVPGPRHV